MRHEGEAAEESNGTLSLAFFERRLYRAMKSYSDDDHSVGSCVGQADEGNVLEKNPAVLTPRDDTSEAVPFSKSAKQEAPSKADVTDGNRMTTKKKRKMLRQLQLKSAKEKKQHGDAARSEKPMSVATVKRSRRDNAPSPARR